MTHLEVKFCGPAEDLSVTSDGTIEGYASLWGRVDQGGDVVERGAYAASLASGRAVKMLWQHDPGQPIGVWDEIVEDHNGLYVKGRLLNEVEKGREAQALLRAGAIDGLSIGYRTRKARKSAAGGRQLTELELWEVSLVTFPMLPDAKVRGKGDAPADDTLTDLAAALSAARQDLARL